MGNLTVCDVFAPTVPRREQSFPVQNQHLMKTSFKSPLVASLLVAGSLSSNVMAEGTGFYARLEPGVSVLKDVKLSSPGIDLKLSSKAGFSISGATGYAFTPSWAVELGSGYSRNEFDNAYDITINGVKSPVSVKYPGHVSMVPIISSVVWSPKLTESVKANLGAGLGAAVVTSEASGSSSTKTVFSSQFRAGLSTLISKNTEANIGYRLCLVSDIEESGSKAKDIMAHIFSAGMTVRF